MCLSHTPEIISQSSAARLAGVSATLIRKKMRSQPPPTWSVFDSPTATWRVDAAHPDFIAYCQGEAQEAAAPDSVKSLAAASAQAQLEIHIQKVELNKYKIEQEKLALKKEAANLIEWDLCEFLFTGYMERINRELLAFPKRISKNVELAIHDGAQTGKTPEATAAVICKLITRETETILREVKAAQKVEVETWKQERDK